MNKSYEKGAEIMPVMENKKASKAIDDFITSASRAGYLVVQANDLARAFGSLSVFEQRMLDYCFSQVKPDDSKNKEYHIDAIDIIKLYGLGNSGRSYLQISKAFNSLNQKTAINIKENDGVLMTSLFLGIKVRKSGKITYRFNPNVAPFIFQLQKNFYYFKLSELALPKSKYTLIMMRLWNAYGNGKWDSMRGIHPSAHIKDALESWESWFLGVDDDGNLRHWPAGRFRQKVLNVALKELGQLYPRTNFSLTTITRGQGGKVLGYSLNISDIQTQVPLNDDLSASKQLSKKLESLH